MEQRIFTGQRIKEAREHLDLTQAELGDKYGVTGVHISRIEQGKVGLELRDIDKFAKILNRPRSYFLPPEESHQELPIAEDVARLIRRIKDFEVKGKSDVTPYDPPIKAVDVFNQPVSGGPDGKLAVDYAEPVELTYVAVDDWKISLKGYIVSGNCLEPVIETGDIIVVDHDLREPNDKDFVLCTHVDEFGDGKVGIKRYRHSGNQTWLEDNNLHYGVEGCYINGVVVQWLKRRKIHRKV